MRLFFLLPNEPSGCDNFFFPRVRMLCGHGAQVIIEGKEIQSDGGEKDTDNPTTNQNKQPKPTGRDSTIKQYFLCTRVKQVRKLTADCLWA